MLWYAIHFISFIHKKEKKLHTYSSRSHECTMAHILCAGIRHIMISYFLLDKIQDHGPHDWGNMFSRRFQKTLDPKNLEFLFVCMDFCRLSGIHLAWHQIIIMSGSSVPVGEFSQKKLPKNVRTTHCITSSLPLIVLIHLKMIVSGWIILLPQLLVVLNHTCASKIIT